MVELSPANLELGPELSASKPLVDFPEAPRSSSGPLDAGETLLEVAEASATPTCLFLSSAPGHFPTVTWAFLAVITGGFIDEMG